MTKQLIHGGYVMTDKLGSVYGLDSASGGYPYYVTNPQDAHISDFDNISKWAFVMNNHGEKDEYRIAKATLTLETEEIKPAQRVKGYTVYMETTGQFRWAIRDAGIRSEKLYDTEDQAWLAAGQSYRQLRNLLLSNAQ